MEATQDTLRILPSKPTGQTDEEIRDRVYKAIAVQVREITGGAIPRVSSRLGSDILDAVVEIMMRTAIKEGYFRLPGGFGSFKTQQLKSTTKRLPTGEIVQLPASRHRLRYEEGAAVRELLGMPYKTSYRRQYVRTSKLTARTTEAAELQPTGTDRR